MPQVSDVSHEAPIVVSGTPYDVGPSDNFHHFVSLKPIFDGRALPIENDIDNRAGILPKDKSHLIQLHG